MEIIKTSRLFLRQLTPSDATEKYAGWLNDPVVNRHLEIRHRKQTVKSCSEFIQTCNFDPGSHLFGIFHKETKIHIGNVKIGFINPHYQRGQVSLLIGEKGFWGQGLSTEVIGAVTAYGFKQLKLNRLEAGCYENNLASLRIFLKNGYTVEGFMREQVVLEGKHFGCFWLGILNHEFTS